VISNDEIRNNQSLIGTDRQTEKRHILDKWIWLTITTTKNDDL